MASSQDSPPSGGEEQNIQFRMLDKIYTISKGYKYVYIPFDKLYQELQAMNAKEQELSKTFEHLYKAGLVDSKAIGNASLTHEGIREYESALLHPDKSAYFPSDIISGVTTESKKNEIRTIQHQRRAFLAKAYELSKDNPTDYLNAFEIMSSLGYDKETIERIYFYLLDEGHIKSFTTGGKFSVTRKGIEQAEKEHND